MGPDTSQIVKSQDRRSRMISGGETARRIILESGLKFKPWFSFGDMWCHQIHFRGEKRVAPNHFLTPPKFGKV
jgi:hypothetical protein